MCTSLRASGLIFASRGNLPDVIKGLRCMLYEARPDTEGFRDGVPHASFANADPELLIMIRARLTAFEWMGIA